MFEKCCDNIRLTFIIFFYNMSIFGVPTFVENIYKMIIRIILTIDSMVMNEHR